MTQGEGLPRVGWPRSLRWCATVLWLGCSLVGCQLPARLSARNAANPQYERANIVYELDGAQRPLPLTDPEVKAAAFLAEDEVSAAAPEWAGATLSLQYPHPDGVTDTARATLRLSAEPLRNSPSALAQATRWLGWNRSGEPSHSPVAADSKQPVRDDEIWVLDLPKQQLDLLLTDLQQSGFFQAQTRSQAGTKLDVQLNGGRVQKEWSAEPRLDHFMSRVYKEGRLEGLVAREATSSHPNIYANVR